MSLPRRDGQGRRRGLLPALAMLWCVASACTGAARPPVDGADAAPPRTVAPVPQPTRAPTPASSNPPSAAVGSAGSPFVAATFDLDLASEASGVAVSVRNPGVVYVLDDGPGTTGVLAVDALSDGSTDAPRRDRTAVVTVDGLGGRDTEALAIGRCGPRDRRSCLFVGDIGNNRRQRTTVAVWRVPEPALDGTMQRLTVDARAATYAYPGDPIDAEALLVDDGRPLLVTKPERDAETGRWPSPRLLAADAFADGTLRDLGTVTLPPPSTPLLTAVLGLVVTGGEVFDDQVVLRTYDHVVRYTPPENGASVTTLGTWEAAEIPSPRLPQPEAVAADACGLWLTSERVDSVWLVPAVARVDDGRTQERGCPTGNARS